VTDVPIDADTSAPSAISLAVLGAEVLGVRSGGAARHVTLRAFHEIALGMRRGKWDAMAPHAARLDAPSASQGFAAAPSEARVAMRAGSVTRDHSDPFDRVIGAAAIDTAVDEANAMPEWRGRSWGAGTVWSRRGGIPSTPISPRSRTLDRPCRTA
jgi:hypothetical protein